MIRLRLSPSKIEKYRQFNEGEYNDTITKESLINSITGKEVWTPQANFGTAFHAVLENGAAKYRTEDFFSGSGEVEPDESTRIYRIQDSDMPRPFECTYAEIEIADKYHEEHLLMAFEIPHKFIFILDGEYEIEISMRVDGLFGNKVKEHKTTDNSGNGYEFYERSCQWRLYVLGFKVDEVEYERFFYKAPTELEEGKTRRKGTRDKIDVVRHTFSFYRYDGLKEYVEANMRGIIVFCNGQVDDKGDSLMKYILR